jgi:hypothetical protein
MLAGCALAENPSDDVSGYNPFDPEGSTDGATGDDATAAFDLAPTTEATPLPSSLSDPFGTGGATLTTTVDPFAAGTADGPFGAVATPTATPMPVVTIPGTNPFDESTLPVQVNAMMFVTASTLKVYSKAEDKARQLTTLVFGDQVNVTATQGEWAQIKTSKGATGYCLMSGLSSANPATMSKQVYAQLNQVPLYRTPSTRSGRYRNFKKGETATLLAITSDGLWSRVTDGANAGFVPTVYLDDAPPAEGTAVWCGVSATGVMVNPDAWVQISTLSFGQPARLVGYINNNTIAKIRNSKGYVAYCDVAALTTSDPATMNTPMYIQCSGKIMSRSATDTAHHTNATKNVRVTLLGVDATQYWALVKMGSRKLYVPYVFLGAERLGKHNKTVALSQDAPLYQTGKAGAAILGTLPMGAQLNLLSAGDGYARVSTVSDGVTQVVTGYMPIQYLRNP